MSRAESYLTLPERYAATGDLVWAHGGDAIESASGDVVALADELKEVLAGAFAAPPVPHFCHLLSAYRRLKIGGEGFDSASAAFHALRLVPGALRHAGRLIARLCGALPSPPDPPTWPEVELALARLTREGVRHRPHLAIEPPLRPSIFESYLKQVLEPFDAETLRHWLTFGSGDKPAGEPIAEPIESLPARVAKALAFERGRLVGAARLVPLLDAALTLPPRQRAANKVPQGGYADVTTRGDPAQLLPSQFALDPDEFVRRFAERELLFFEREEPHAPEPASRMILLDQGVRTWGVVRLALAAAAAALLSKDAKKCGAAEFATSGSGKMDLSTLSAEQIGDHLAASDLSETPQALIADMLASGTAMPRDIVLLTHPRSLADPSLIDAIAERNSDDRLFSLAVRDDGQAELTEWRDGGPVLLRDFRVDLTPPVEKKATPRLVERSGCDWSGDREPIGFPFRPGLIGEITLCGVDAAGETLVAVSREGVPQLLTADDSVEVLPRAFRGGKVLREVEAVLGVRGGMVICGRMTPTNPAGVHRVAAHYDFATRSVLLHDLGEFDRTPIWQAHPDLHGVSLRNAPTNTHPVARGLDLDSGEQSSEQTQTGTSRAALACGRSHGAPCEVSIIRGSVTGADCSSPTLFVLSSGELTLRGTADAWSLFTTQSEGRKLFDHARLRATRALLAGNTLAVTRDDKKPQLYLFRGPEGVALRSLTLGNHGHFALNADGERLAVVLNGEARLMDVSDAGATVATGHRAKLHSGLEVVAGAVNVVIGVGSFTHVFHVNGGRLRHAIERAPWKSKATAQPTGYDPRRLRRIAAEDARYQVWADQLGQVVLVDTDDRPVLAFLVRRDKVAVWGRPNIFWGDPTLIGGPPTPDADARLAALFTGDQS